MLTTVALQGFTNRRKSKQQYYLYNLNNINKAWVTEVSSQHLFHMKKLSHNPLQIKHVEEYNDIAPVEH